MSRARRGVRIEDTRQVTDVGSFRVRGLHKGYLAFYFAGILKIQLKMHCCVCFLSDVCGLQRAEWNEGEREKQRKRRKRCVEGLSGEGRQVEVSVERWGCEGMKAVGAYDPKQLLHLCSLFEVVASPWSFFKNGRFYVPHVCAAGLSPFTKAVVCHMHSAPPMAAGKCFVLTFAF